MTPLACSLLRQLARSRGGVLRTSVAAEVRAARCLQDGGLVTVTPVREMVRLGITDRGRERAEEVTP